MTAENFKNFIRIENEHVGRTQERFRQSHRTMTKLPQLIEDKAEFGQKLWKNFWAKISEKDLLYFPNPPNPNVLPELISSTALFIIRLKNSVQKDIYSNIFVLKPFIKTRTENDQWEVGWVLSIRPEMSLEFSFAKSRCYIQKLFDKMSPGLRKREQSTSLSRLMF